MRSKGELKMVAAAAGVSPSTVSRALRGHPGIAEATRKRVREAADRFGYTPDARLARFFREMHQGTRMVVLLVSPDRYMQVVHGDPFYTRINWVIQGELQRRNYFMLLANAGTDLLPDGRSHSIVETSAVGIITSMNDATELVPLISQVPVVQFNAECPGLAVDAVLPNVEQAASEQIDHLKDLGHRAIACFRPRSSGIPPHGWSWQDRRYWRAFEDRVRSLGLALPKEYLAPIQFGPGQDEAAVRAFLDRVLESSKPPTAILTYDTYANELIRQLGKRGLQTPQDISIMGYDDHPFAHPGTTPLSTFRQDFETMAAAAVDLLLQRIKDPTRPPILIQVPGKVILRESTGPAPKKAAAKA